MSWLLCVIAVVWFDCGLSTLYDTGLEKKLKESIVWLAEQS